MSPMMSEMLVHEVIPRLRNTARSVPKIGCEDNEEIVQDTTLMAARMMDSAEKSEQKFTGSTVAYYAAKAARSGRRSYYSGRCDVMSSAFVPRQQQQQQQRPGHRVSICIGHHKLFFISRQIHWAHRQPNAQTTLRYNGSSRYKPLMETIIINPMSKTLGCW